jgi:hypothetical protein
LRDAQKGEDTLLPLTWPFQAKLIPCFEQQTFFLSIGESGD